MKNLFQTASISNEPTETKQTVQNTSKLRRVGVFAITGVCVVGIVYAATSMAFFGGNTPEEIQTNIDNRIIEIKSELRDLEIDRLQARKRVSQAKIKDLKRQIDPDTENDFTQILSEIQTLNDHIQFANGKINNMNSGISFFDITLSESEVLGNENAAE